MSGSSPDDAGCLDINGNGRDPSRNRTGDRDCTSSLVQRTVALLSDRELVSLQFRADVMLSRAALSACAHRIAGKFKNVQRGNTYTTERRLTILSLGKQDNFTRATVALWVNSMGTGFRSASCAEKR
jgi:hypothetical protein